MVFMMTPPEVFWHRYHDGTKPSPTIEMGGTVGKLRSITRVDGDRGVLISVLDFQKPRQEVWAEVRPGGGFVGKNNRWRVEGFRLIDNAGV